jgi:hypothetical protein
MFKNFRKGTFFSFLVLAGLLAACSGSPTAQPTVDANAIFTAAAQTVQAQLTVAAVANPTATLTPAPTEVPTLLPTVPPEATIAVVPAEPTVAGGNPTAAGIPTLSIMLTPGTTPVSLTTPLALATLPPIVTATTVQTTTDRGEVVDQDPDDNTTVGNNADFDMSWDVKNTGTSNWIPGSGNCTDGYYIAFAGGDRIGSGYSNWYCIKQTIVPGATLHIIVDMKTPGTDGTYHSMWCIMNSQKKCFRMLDVTLNVQ